MLMSSSSFPTLFSVILFLMKLSYSEAHNDVQFMLDSVNEHYTPRGRCVLWKIPGHSLVQGKVTATPPANARIGVYAYDPQGNQPFSRPDLSGEISFSFRSADVPTEYEICLRMHSKTGYGPVPGNPITPIKLSLTHSFDLFDDEKARDLKVKPIEREFRQLEENIRETVRETNNLKDVQQAMRDTNENTFDMIKYLGILSFFIFVGLNVYQVYYMKRFFKSKKLI